jgi:hypothetical protein
MHLLGSEAMWMRMKPIQPRPIPHLEAHRLARTWQDRIEAGPVSRFRKRQPVKVDGRGLREAILDDGIEVLTASRNDDRLQDIPRAEVGNVLAATEYGIRSFD